MLQPLVLLLLALPPLLQAQLLLPQLSPTSPPSPPTPASPPANVLVPRQQRPSTGASGSQSSSVSIPNTAPNLLSLGSSFAASSAPRWFVASIPPHHTPELCSLDPNEYLALVGSFPSPSSPAKSPSGEKGDKEDRSTHPVSHLSSLTPPTWEGGLGRVSSSGVTSSIDSFARTDHSQTIDWAGGMIDWSSPAYTSSNAFTAHVQWVSIDCYSGSDLNLPEKVLHLADLTAPRLGTRDRDDEPWAFESRDFLRSLVVGKEVSFSISYTVPSDSNPSQPLEFGIVYVVNPTDGSEVDVAAELVRSGWAKVRDSSKRDQAHGDSEDGQAVAQRRAYLRDLEEEAKIVGTRSIAANEMNVLPDDVEPGEDDNRVEEELLRSRARAKVAKMEVDHPLVFPTKPILPSTHQLVSTATPPLSANIAQPSDFGDASTKGSSSTDSAERGGGPASFKAAEEIHSLHSWMMTRYDTLGL
ncbi:hypothetical protein JCM10295v2_007249 [Rhodotorula toruloides]